MSIPPARRDQRAEHEARLSAFMSGLKGDLGRAANSGWSRRHAARVHAPWRIQRQRLLAAAREAGADILLVEGVHKMSTLVQNAKIVRSTPGRSGSCSKTLHLSRRHRKPGGGPKPSFLTKFAALEGGSPTKIAVFDFELDDPAPAADRGDAAADLRNWIGHEEARRTISARRYHLVDVSSAEGDDVNRARCGTATAAKPPSQKARRRSILCRVVTRISRTEYTVRFQIRDAHTGAVIIARQSDLRIGADYSWNRGAATLIKSSLLNDP